MAKIILIGATHSEELDGAGHRTILGDQSDKYFFKKYGNAIDEKTLIISEGHYDTDLITPDRSKYAHRLRKISYLLSYHKKTPHLLVRDHRYTLSKKEFEDYGTQMEQLQAFGVKHLPHITFTKPATMGDMLRTVKKDAWNMQLPVVPDQKLRDVAKKFLLVDELVDGLFTGSVHEYQDQYEKIFVILGTTHVLNISRKFDWDIDVTSGELGFKGMFDVAISYLTLRELAKIIS